MLVLLMLMTLMMMMNLMMWQWHEKELVQRDSWLVQRVGLFDRQTMMLMMMMSTMMTWMWTLMHQLYRPLDDLPWASS